MVTRVLELQFSFLICVWFLTTSLCTCRLRKETTRQKLFEEILAKIMSSDINKRTSYNDHKIAEISNLESHNLAATERNAQLTPSDQKAGKGLAKETSANLGLQNSDSTVLRKDHSNIALEALDQKTATDSSSDLVSQIYANVFPRLVNRLDAIAHMKTLPPKVSQNSRAEPQAATLSPEMKKSLADVSLKCLSQCDSHDGQSRTCWFNRQVGDTLTFAIGHKGSKPSYWKDGTLHIEWHRVHHSLSGKDVMEKLYPVSNASEYDTVAIGSSGLRMMIRPIKDVDMDFNSFRVAAVTASSSPEGDTIKLADITFRINILPIDMGYVYIGEELTIHIEDYITLGPDFQKLEWTMESETYEPYALPPNMRVKNNGRSLLISELSPEQKGIVVCGIYSSNSLFLAKRKFLIREPALPVIQTAEPEMQLDGNGSTKRNVRQYSARKLD